MPAQQRVGFEDEQRIFPVTDATGEKHEPEAVGLGKRGFFDVAVKDDQLLTKESIFGNEFGSIAGEVCDSAENNRMAGGLGEMQKGLFKRRKRTDKWLEQQMQEGMHVGGLRKSSQKLSTDCIPCAMGVNFLSDEVSREHNRNDDCGLGLPWHRFLPARV